MKFKKISYLAILVLLGACTKDVLTVSSNQYVLDKLSITNAKSAEAAVYGVYNQLQSTEYYGGAGFGSLNFLLGDNAKWTGSLNYFNNLVTHTYSSDNTAITNAWSAIYATINAANNVIEGVPTVVDPLLTQVNRNRFLGEAYFVRALAYFDLVKTWGGVPIILKPTRTAADGVGIGRSTAEETWQQVKKDLDIAEGLLPATINRNRANKSTVYALRARYFLYRKDWVNAELEASKILNDGNFTPLAGPYSTFFKTKGSKESIFELAASTSDQNSLSSNWLSPADGGVRQWAPNDAIATLLKNPAIGGNRSELIKSLSAADPNNYVGILYYRGTKDDPAYLLRVAEQFLIRAEARAQIGVDLSGARDDLNAVRTRAGIPLSTANTAAALLDAIAAERRVEFALEGHRWYDLIRTGKANEVLGISVNDSYRFLLPIPINDLKADPDLTPNPGY